MEQELIKLYHLLLEKYPWAEKQLIWNYNKILNYIHYKAPINSYKKPLKLIFLFLKNPDKFTITEPHKIECSKFIGLKLPLMEHIPNLSQLDVSIVNNFDPIQIIEYKNKIIGVWDGNHRAIINLSLLVPVKCVVIQSHKYNDHPNNKKIKKLANSLYKKLF